MTLKEAVANSLLMFVAATCVVLITRAVAPTPQIQQVVAGTVGASGDSMPGTPTLAVPDGTIVYYLHGNVRCPTCRSIEAYAEEAVRTGSPDQLQAGTIRWQVVNYESPGNEHFALDYEVVAPSVVLAKYEGGRQIEWKGLPEVWEHVGDKAAFVNFVQKSLREFIGEGSELQEPAISQQPTASPEPMISQQSTISPEPPVPQQRAAAPQNPMRSSDDSPTMFLPLPE